MVNVTLCCVFGPSDDDLSILTRRAELSGVPEKGSMVWIRNGDNTTAFFMVHGLQYIEGGGVLVQGRLSGSAHHTVQDYHEMGFETEKGKGYAELAKEELQGKVLWYRKP